MIWHRTQKPRCCSIAGFIFQLWLVLTVATCAAYTSTPATAHSTKASGVRPHTSQPHSGQKRLSPTVVRLGHLQPEALPSPLPSSYGYRGPLLRPDSCCTSFPLSFCFSTVLQMGCKYMMAYSKGVFQKTISERIIRIHSGFAMFPNLILLFYFLKKVTL